jgi:hypothetical protein
MMKKLLDISPQSFKVKLITPKWALDSHPKPKKYKYTKERFEKRQQARQWCRNHFFSATHDGMFIVHPDKTIEEYLPTDKY